MTKHKHEPRHPQHLEEDVIDVRHPYWQRAHRDWRFLTVVFLMLVAMVTYVMNYGWMGWGHPRSIPLSDGK